MVPSDPKLKLSYVQMEVIVQSTSWPLSVKFKMNNKTCATCDMVTCDVRGYSSRVTGAGVVRYDNVWESKYS